ncbi:serine hydrolase domain-containing protein [Microscilla marina]|uniref:Beta-lactamase n=1 Tax=Microscilla marina ATCC 23134 TaxID=313606 RepID=A1ZMJ2_MICM2|nr:serine hydrolase domain-containing protein [Microscilla marina]EAY28372.1 beta-lactamase [Microscilla marina ATCC 23134]
MQKILTYQLFVALLLTIHLPLQLSAQDKTISKKDLLKEWHKLDKFKEFVKAKQPDFPYHVALVYKGKVISEKTNSYANIEKKQKLNNKTIHRWGSVSKLFMTVSMLQLVEKNKISLEDPITKWLPEVGKGVDSLGGMQAVKIYHLLNHTAGISIRKGYLMSRKDIKERMKKLGKPDRFATIKEFIPYLKYTEQKRRPGAKYSYDNGGYSLLGIILERVTKVGFREYVQQNIFAPLKMKNTSYYKVPENRVKQVETLYGWFPDEKTGKLKLYNNNRNVSQGMLGPNGGIKSTPEDMVKFMRFFRFREYKPRKYKYEQVLKQATLDKYIYNITVKQPNEKQFSTGLIDKKISRYRILGVSRRDSKTSNNVSYGHSGKVNFARSNFMFNKKHSVGIIMMTTMGGQKNSNARVLASKLFGLTFQFVSEGNFGNLLNKINSDQQK